MGKLGGKLLGRTGGAIDVWTEFTGYLSGFIVLAASLVIAEAVFVRKVLGHSTSWQNEMAVYLLMAATFLGAAYTQKHEGHVGIDLVAIYVPQKGRRIIGTVGSVLGFIVAVVIARYAWPIWWETIEFNQHSESLWGPHLAFPYIIIPLGMSFLALQYLVHIGRKIAEFRAQPKAQPAAQGAPGKEVA